MISSLFSKEYYEAGFGISCPSAFFSIVGGKSLQTTFPRLSYQQASGWVWPVGGTGGRLEGRKRGEDQLFLLLFLL